MAQPDYDRTATMKRPALYTRREHFGDVALAGIFGFALGALAALILIGTRV